MCAWQWYDLNLSFEYSASRCIIAYSRLFEPSSLFFDPKSRCRLWRMITNLPTTSTYLQFSMRFRDFHLWHKKGRSYLTYLSPRKATTFSCQRSGQIHLVRCEPRAWPSSLCWFQCPSRSVDSTCDGRVVNSFDSPIMPKPHSTIHPGACGNSEKPKFASCWWMDHAFDKAPWNLTMHAPRHWLGGRECAGLYLTKYNSSMSVNSNGWMLGWLSIPLQSIL